MTEGPDMDSMTEQREVDLPKRSRHPGLLWGVAALVAVIALSGVVFLSRTDGDAPAAPAAASAVTVTINGERVSAAVVDGSIKREAAVNPQVADDRDLLESRGGASAALEELLVRNGETATKVTSEQIDEMILHADAVFPVGTEPPKEWSDADRGSAVKDPEVRAAVERMLYRSAGVGAVLGDVAKPDLTSETGNAVVGAWFADQLKSVKVIVTLADGTVLSNDDLVRAVEPLPTEAQPTETVVGSEVSPPAEQPFGN